MLPEKITEILAAAVDGELSSRQRRAVQRLLDQNDEARRLYKQMKRDAERLNALPRQSLAPHFASRVLQSIGERPTPLPAAVGRVAQKYLPMWAIVCAAAAVMLAVSLGTYLIAVSAEQQRAAELAERNRRSAPPVVPELHPSPQNSSVAKVTPERVEPLPSPREDDDNAIAVAPLPEMADPVEAGDPKILAVPFNPKISLFTVEMPKLPPILPVRELDQLHRGVLLDTMKGHDALQLDLFSKDANKAFNSLQTVLRGQNKKLLVEALAQLRLQQKLKTNFVFYTECLTPDEVTRLFAALAAEDKKAEARKDAQLEKLVVMPMSSTSQRTMATLLGADPKTFLPKSKPNGGIDIQKPITEDTEKSLEKALADKAKTGSAAPKTASEPVVIALSFNPVRPNPQMSKEVRDFLATRNGRKPGTVPVMIVVRNLD